MKKLDIFAFGAGVLLIVCTVFVYKSIGKQSEDLFPPAPPLAKVVLPVPGAQGVQVVPFVPPVVSAPISTPEVSVPEPSSRSLVHVEAVPPPHEVYDPGPSKPARVVKLPNGVKPRTVTAYKWVQAYRKWEPTATEGFDQHYFGNTQPVVDGDIRLFPDGPYGVGHAEWVRLDGTSYYLKMVKGKDGTYARDPYVYAHYDFATPPSDLVPDPNKKEEVYSVMVNTAGYVPLWKILGSPEPPPPTPQRRAKFRP